jgi:glycosyltransferase involved in cell wall biosynthesis
MTDDRCYLSINPQSSMNILLLGHSYVVALNRRICRELALAGEGRIRVTVAAPSFYHGDLQPIRLEPVEGEPFRLEPVTTRFSKIPHVFLYGRRLKKLLRAERWDVVHAWEEPYILASAQVAYHTRRDARLIFSSFQNQPKSYPPPFNGIERYCLGRASGWTAFGRTVDENLRDRPGYRDRPSAVIPPGVDVDVFRPDPEARRAVFQALEWSPDGAPVVGFLGRFVAQKGVELLQQALDRLDPASWRALWVGGGPMEESLRTWAARHGDRVRVVTGVRHDGVPAYLNALDVLAAPSQTTPQWREQFGRMLVEAMACGVPVVASDSGEIPHVVADAGRIVPEADETAWVVELRDLLASPDRRRELRERGLVRAREVYAWPIIARKYLEFFQRVRDTSSRASDHRLRNPAFSSKPAFSKEERSAGRGE